MKRTSSENLEERIGQLRSEINALIEARAQAVADDSPGVPVGVIRNMLIARAPTCPCTQYLELFAELK
ncbi:hypothetical protein ES703_06670 [subsurface metagenome]|jgi:hypothetical protein